MATPIQHPVAHQQPPTRGRQQQSQASRPKPQSLTPLLQSPPQAVPSPSPLQPSLQKPANTLFNSNSRFRNTRTFSGPTTTSTTTSAPLPVAPGPTLADYEYDYNDYNNETAAGGLANAASSLQAHIIENIAEAIAKESKAVASAIKNEHDNSMVATSAIGSSVAADQMNSATVISRQKRETESQQQQQPWMLSRRKGQLVEALGDLMTLTTNTNDDDNDELQSSNVTSLTLPISFTCEDKIAGVAYADIASGCNKFYICVTVAKGKLWSYHLNCDQDKRFNQMLGMCDTSLSEKACVHSERYYMYNKWHKQSKKHFLNNNNNNKKKIDNKMMKMMKMT